MKEAADIVVLALDQSPTNTGWALGKPMEVKPAYGLFALPTWGDNEGQRLCDFEDWLRTKIKSAGVTHLFYESPVDVRFKSFDITIKQGAQIGKIWATAWRCGQVPVAQVAVDSWRSRFLGTTKAPPGLKGDNARQALKQMALKACAMRDWLVDDDNVAEALGILDFGLSTLSQRHAGHRDPIFRRAELQQDVARFRGGQ